MTFTSEIPHARVASIQKLCDSSTSKNNQSFLSTPKFLIKRKFRYFVKQDAKHSIQTIPMKN